MSRIKTGKKYIFKPMTQLTHVIETAGLVKVLGKRADAYHETGALWLVRNVENGNEAHAYEEELEEV